MSANNSPNLNHPVMEVYKDYKTTVWNAKIQQAELDRLQLLNRWIEIPLAVLASSSVTSMAIWQTSSGAVIWGGLGGATAILAVIKPFLRIPEKIEQRGKMLADFCALEHDLETIKKSVSHQRTYDDKLQGLYFKALGKKGKIRDKYTGANHLKNNENIKERCREEVDRQLPVSEFYFPEV